MGKVKYMTLKNGSDGLPHLVAEKSCEAFDLRTRLDSPDKIFEAISGFGWSDYTEEHVCCIALTQNCKPIALFDIAHGSYVSCQIDMRALFTRILLTGCTCFILLHNHPSGDPSPSQQDMMFTGRVKEAAGLLQLDLLDHIILGNDNHGGWDGCKYYSFKEAQAL